MGCAAAFGLEEQQVARLDLLIVYFGAYLILRPDITRYSDAVPCEDIVNETAAVETAFRLGATQTIGGSAELKGGARHEEAIDRGFRIGGSPFGPVRVSFGTRGAGVGS
jgi:hypothetical protein